MSVALRPLGGDTPLPTLPIVVARLVALYSTEDYTAEDVVALLETDPPISGRLLRLANSAYYGFAGHVDSLQRATVLLGRTAVQAVALGATLLKRWRGGAPAQVQELWVHTYLTGIACRYLARRLPRHPFRSEPDTLFLVGLLHDVGKFHFLGSDTETYADALAEKTGLPLRQWEEERFGRNHAEAGGDILDAWNLPAWMASLVRYHHGGELRAELRTNAEVFEAAHAVVKNQGWLETLTLPEALAKDLRTHLEKMRPEAEAAYEAIT